ncbi:hypothetical protein O0I10_000560 [Lichtheimia ornata]|uniref:Phospholipase B1, membrane-associated n=1 Tax=Lichtheimia ornata TaxID=688661 RepID=A0AAD7Y3Y6_9FUNG|nr:uncharacterized protein O0I10_000560 [Lichtheimia ornata]KAJ8663321.1 hypothetical protein O0I10_000560 [Lichtheimia ornata]
MSIVFRAQASAISPDGKPLPPPVGNNSNDNVPLIIDCPRLPPREGAKSVQDLRPDDIRLVMGIGDSVMAGFGAKGIVNNRFISLNTLKENRGVSFAMGGDPGAMTVPNLIQYYSPNLLGSSVGDHMISICFGDEICPKGQYRESIDKMNAAQSGARSLNLDHEIDYLLERLDELYHDQQIQPTDWKLLTFFIGSNDICHSCTTPTSLPIPFAINAADAIDRIRKSIRNVLVQVVGVMRVDEIFIETQAYPEYCQPFPRSSFVMHDHECECAHSEANRTIMRTLTPQYNTALESIVSRYPSNDTFAVVFQPLKMDVSSFPIQVISDVDCFHPSVVGHSWFAKELWQMMFLPSQQKQMTLKFNENAPIYCPTEADRFRVD